MIALINSANTNQLDVVVIERMYGISTTGAANDATRKAMIDRLMGPSMLCLHRRAGFDVPPHFVCLMTCCDWLCHTLLIVLAKELPGA
jgi:hypothetical protein